MSRIDPTVFADALEEGFRQDIAEKVHRLLGILRHLEERRETAGRFTLKGGTALNVFHLPDLPRLSVDIDLMATGFPDASPGKPERNSALGILKDALEALDYQVQPTRSDDGAGVTFLGTYRNTQGGEDLIKVDVDLLNRQTLLPPRKLPGPRLFLADDLVFPVACEAELFAQKLAAVAYRGHARDLFDMHRMIHLDWHVRERAREAYLAYSILSDGQGEWYRLDYPTRLRVPYDSRDLDDVLRVQDTAPSLGDIRDMAVEALSGEPSFIVPTPEETRLHRELLAGRLEAFAELLRETDPAQRTRLAGHPGLAWRLKSRR